MELAWAGSFPAVVESGREDSVVQVLVDKRSATLQSHK